MERLKRFLALCDVPGGSLMGVFTGLVILSSAALIGMRLHNPALSVEFPQSVVEIYKFVIITFAGSKSVATIWGKSVSGENKQ
jgi:hypothetical protein